MRTSCNGAADMHADIRSCMPLCTQADIVARLAVDAALTRPQDRPQWPPQLVAEGHETEGQKMIAFNSSNRRNYDRELSERQQAKTVRALQLVDLLAPLRYGKSTHEIARRYNDKHGTRWCARTIQRDLMMLQSMGLAERCEHGWRLLLRTSEALQAAAIAIDAIDAQPTSSDVEVWTVSHDCTRDGRTICKSVGCQVEAEHMAYLLRRAGYTAESRCVTCAV